MTNKQRRFRNAGPAVTLVVVFTLAMTLLGPSASSHSGLIARTWQRDKTVQYDFTSSVGNMPNGAENAINKGAEDWNGLNGSVTLNPGSNVGNYSPDECPATFAQNAIHYKPIDGPSSVLAVATTCRFTSGNELYSMQITFDTAENWYTGTGNPSSGQIDLWAVATHEFGHTIGIAHFDAADAVCSNNTRQTMCPFYAVSQRGPADHDVHGFSAAYGGAAPEEEEPPPEDEPTTQAPPENVAPEGANLTVKVNQGSKFRGRLDVTDPEGKAVTIELTGDNFNETKQQFTHSFGTPGRTNWTITPSARVGTRMFFTYRACDPDGECSPALKVTIVVR